MIRFSPYPAGAEGTPSPRCLIAASVWLLASAAISFAQTPAAQAIDHGVAAMGQGDFAGAEQAFRRAVEAEPKNARAWKALGVAFAAQGVHAEASEPFSKACALDRKEADACYYLARNHYLLNRFAESLAIFDKLARDAKGDWRFANGRGLALLAMARYPEAEEAFQRAIDTEGGRTSQRGGASPDEDPSVNLGNLYSRSGQPEKARDVLRAFLRRKPAAARGWFELGKVELQLGLLDEARASLLSALQTRPQYREAHLLLSKVYGRLGDGAKAEEQRNLGLARQP
ncbi:MAG: tetratricopeptide repeat protein [Bryobacterales bacterium]|nr:tetratricopeptide repeat protein [Bryobacterales bacterium]